MMNWNSITYNRQHRAALLREADRARVARHATQGRAVPRVFRGLYAWAGRRLVTVGFGLLVTAREWEYRSNTVYNGAKLTVQ